MTSLSTAAYSLYGTRKRGLGPAGMPLPWARRTSGAARHSGRGPRRLWRERTPKAPALRAAVKAERQAFRLKRELERLDPEDPEPAQRNAVLPAVRRIVQVIGVAREHGAPPGARGPTTSLEDSESFPGRVF